MKSGFVGVGIVAVAIALVGSSSAFAQVGICFNCSSCQSALENPENSTVFLLSDQNGISTTCMSLTSVANWKTFDCAGRTLDSSLNLNTSAFDLDGVQGLTIRNCRFTEFDHAVVVSGGSFNRIENSTFQGNSIALQVELDSTSNRVVESSFTGNSQGILMDDSSSNQLLSNDLCSNTVDISITGTGTGNTGGSNRCESAFGYDDPGATGCSRSCSSARLEELVACRDMVKVGNSWMSWLTDQVSRNDGFEPEGGSYDILPLDPLPYWELSDMLFPFYMQMPPPAVDPWGQPYEYRLGSNLLAANVLLVRSGGSDGLFEGTTYQVGSTEVGTEDLMWADGSWVREPPECDGLIFVDDLESEGTVQWSGTRP